MKGQEHSGMAKLVEEMRENGQVGRLNKAVNQHDLRLEVDRER